MAGSPKMEESDWELRLLPELWALQKLDQFCDVILESRDGHPVSAHACVLIAVSPLLRQNLTSHRPALSIVRTQLSRPVLLGLVEFIYTGKVTTKATISDLLAAAGVLDMSLPQSIHIAQSQNVQTTGSSIEHEQSHTGVLQNTASDTSDASAVKREMNTDTNVVVNTDGNQLTRIHKPCLEQILSLDGIGNCSVVSQKVYLRSDVVEVLQDSDTNTAAQLVPGDVKQEAPGHDTDVQEAPGYDIDVENKGGQVSAGAPLDESTDEYQVDSAVEDYDEISTTTKNHRKKSSSPRTRKSSRHVKVIAKKRGRGETSQICQETGGGDRREPHGPERFWR